ncbi:MAG: TonB-dependent receptor [Opitutus sp.]|nr:TonB-dependent receptor [Opitutus sp.]
MHSLHRRLCPTPRLAAFALLSLASLPAQTAPSTPAATASGPHKEDEVVTLAPFEVLSDKGTRGYGTTNAMGATRVNAPIENTPQSIISLNQEFMKDVKPASFMEALRFVSGVTKGSGGEYGGDVTLRGVTSEAIGYRDGIADRLSTSAAGLATVPDPIEVERLEVIKGPAGALYGSHSFGGLINRVSKRPLATRRTEIGAGYTSYADSESYSRGTLDTTGPIDTGKKFLYRLVSSYQDGTNHMHGRFGKSLVIGTLEFRPDAATAAWVRSRYSDDRTTAVQDLWTDSQRNMPFGHLPRNPWIGNYYNDDQVDKVIAKAQEFGITRAFSALGTPWSARLLVRRNEVSGSRRTYIDSGNIFFRNGVALKVGTADMTTNNATWAQATAAGFDDLRENILRRDIRNGDSRATSFNFDLTGTFKLGPTEHTLLLYAGKADDETLGRRFRENWIAAKPSLYRRTSVPPETVLDGRPQTLANEWTTTKTSYTNHAVQDNIALLRGKLILVGGVRYDSGETKVFDHLVNRALAPVKVTHWTPTYGVVGKPVKGVSIFGLHSETFQPQGGVNQAGERLRPLLGVDNEVGLKLDLFRERVVMTASHFNMSQENAFLKIIHPDGTFDFTQVPSSSTRGWEMDLATQPIDHLTMMVGYQWLQARTQSGLSIANVPQGGTYKGLMKYSISQGPLKNLSLGLSYEFVNDRRAGDANNTYFLPGYQLVGLLGYYTWRSWRFQVNVENLNDVWFVAGSTSQQFMRSGAPRNFRFSSTYTF